MMANAMHSPTAFPMPKTNDVIGKIRSFLQDNFLYLRPDDFQLGDDDRLLERGIIDSMGIVEMITFIEDTFGVKVAEDEISEANLGSLTAIARFVGAKLAEA